MAISAKDVKRLRDMTGVGMMDCKKALQEANGDFDAAVELLRKKGEKVAAKRADREASEGLIQIALTDGGQTAAIAEVNCETDFVARNDDFAAFAERITDLILAERPADNDALNALTYEGDKTVGDVIIEMTGKIGEKIDVRRFEIVEAPEDGRIVSYIHPGSALGVLIKASGDGDIETVARDVAMQVAAMQPIATTRDDVDDDIKQKELEIGRAQAIEQNKPEHIIDRIATGKLERFFKDHVLMEQPFVKDSSVSVQDMLKKEDVSVSGFVRFALGE